MRASDFRERARQMLRGKWPMAILTSFVALILGGLMVKASVNIDLDMEILNHLPKFIRTYLKIAASVGGVLGFVQFIIGGTVKLGYCKYQLKLYNNEPADIKDLFSQFDRFADGFVLRLLTFIYIFLWTLLFIIPGFIAAYKYAMAPFILLENPGMKPNDAITASKELMDGHKGELFFLELSFIGWILLNGLTLGIGSLWLNPYMNAARTVFYRYLRPVPVIYATRETAPEEGNPWDQLTPEV